MTSPKLPERTLDLRRKFCGHPFEFFQVGPDGISSLCCTNWLPTTIGDLSKESVTEVWNSPVAQEIRRSVLDGSFKYCNEKQCPHIQQDRLFDREHLDRGGVSYRWGSVDYFRRKIQEYDRGEVDRALNSDAPPVFLNLCYDESCNLTCPSCRTQRISHSAGPDFDQRRALHLKIIQEFLTVPHDRDIRLNITGSGDPFFSKLFREFLFGLDGSKFPNLVISLQTNGVMLTPQAWQAMHRLHGHFDTVSVSVDAASETTYDRVRVGGNWSRLGDNMRHISKLRARGEIAKFWLNFVVQANNFEEMPAFVRLGREIGNVDCLEFARLTDWRTWDRPTYEKMSVCDPGHPDHERLRHILRDPVFDDPMVSLGNLGHLRPPRAVRAPEATISF